jgi:hypothetical protein
LYFNALLSSLCRLERHSPSVIPEAGIQAGLYLNKETNLDAGVRRHDGLTSPEGKGGFQPSQNKLKIWGY